jgi:hypothetical protein
VEHGKDVYKKEKTARCLLNAQRSQSTHAMQQRMRNGISAKRKADRHKHISVSLMRETDRRRDAMHLHDSLMMLDNAPHAHLGTHRPLAHNALLFILL